MGKAALAQRQPELATKLLEAAWRRDPKHTALRITLWQARLASQSEAITLQQLHAALEHVTDADELRLVLQLLAQLAPLGTVAGTVQYDPVQGMIHGWAVNLHAPKTPASLQLAIGERTAAFQAQAPHALLTQAGWPATHGGFRIKVTPKRQPVHVRAAPGQQTSSIDASQGHITVHTELTGSPLALAPILPGVPGNPHADTAEFQTVEAVAVSLPTAKPKTPAKPAKRPTGKSARPDASQKRIDVLIPVFEGYDETLACIHSVLRARQANRSQHDIIVLNDASPNTELTQALSQLAQAGKIVHIVRPANLGFIRNMNRGMALHPDRDVVWLNADTQVHGNWLDRLRAAAYASKKTASAAPFTNNGELLSFPESRVSHPMPSARELAQLDNLAKKQPATPITIETGCGFCLYIKRSALDSVGYLDEIVLQRGYGEETDWCLRAREQGWQHVAAPNVFVAHQGGVSFKDEKALRVQHNNEILRKRYPGAEARYEAISRNDPLAPARQTLQRARLTVLPSWIRAYQQEGMQ
nr:glycosyltransferase family 2 protein [Pseudomonas sp.]